MDRVVHEGVRFHKVHGHVWKRSGVVHACTRPWLGHFFRKYTQPIAVYGLLLLERTLEDFEDVLHGERADGRAPDRIHRGREHPINQSGTFTGVNTFRDVAGRLWNNYKSFDRFLTFNIPYIFRYELQNLLRDTILFEIMFKGRFDILFV